MAENTPALSDLPKGAVVRLSFEGKFIGGDNDYRFVELRISDGPIRVKWEQSADAAEDYEPEITVLDYGFRPGDVCTARSMDGTPVTFFATIGSGEHDRPIEWMDMHGMHVDVDLADLTLIVRDGFAVTSDD